MKIAAHPPSTYQNQKNRDVVPNLRKTEFSQWAWYGYWIRG